MTESFSFDVRNSRVKISPTTDLDPKLRVGANVDKAGLHVNSGNRGWGYVNEPMQAEVDRSGEVANVWARRLQRKIIILAIALGMLPVLAVGTVTYHFGNQVITEQATRLRRTGVVGTTEALVLQRRQQGLLAILLTGTGVTALLVGWGAAIWAKCAMGSMNTLTSTTAIPSSETPRTPTQALNVTESASYSDNSHSQVSASQPVTPIPSESVEQAVQQLTEFIELIKELSAQMNYQAVNATIGAGRAGDANHESVIVMAEAVRSLTQQLIRATANAEAVVTTLAIKANPELTSPEQFEIDAVQDVQQHLQQVVNVLVNESLAKLTHPPLQPNSSSSSPGASATR
jgi:hypothetical protein